MQDREKFFFFTIYDNQPSKYNDKENTINLFFLNVNIYLPRKRIHKYININYMYQFNLIEFLLLN